MPRKHVVKELNDEQFSFVISAIIDGLTDREISSSFQKTFNQPLAKSSLHRWRNSAGNELAERYRLARYQAKQLLENINTEADADKYQIVIQNIEDRLLTATRDVISQDPIKLLQVRQEEERRKLRQRYLDLKEAQLNWQKERVQKEENLHTDRFKIAADTWQFVLHWFNENDPKGTDVLVKNNEQLLNDLEAHISQNS